MNDLVDLQWDGSPSNSQNTLSPNAPNPSSLRPTSPNISRQSTPISAAQSGRSTPLSALNTGNNKSSAQDASSSKSAGMDSFSNLLPTKKSTAQISMQERQKQLIEERARQAAEQQKRHNEQFKVGDNQFWEEFGKSSGRSTPALNGQPAAQNQTSTANDDEDDIMAAFKSSAPVDTSSHFPPPERTDKHLNESKTSRSPLSAQGDQMQELSLHDDDDDPFGLGDMPAPKVGLDNSSRQPAGAPLVSEEDDILGDLGKPVTESALPGAHSPAPAVQPAMSSNSSNGARDRAIAELVDMGFPFEKAREALDHTGTGTDVQAAVGWLVNQAHEDSRAKAHGGSRREPPAEMPQQDVLAADRDGYLGQKSHAVNRDDSKSSSQIDKDVAHRASEIGNSFFKSANSIWRQGQKRMQKAMAEFQGEGDPSQPRWLQQSQPSRSNAQSPSDAAEDISRTAQATDEAMMLDIQKPAPLPPRQPKNKLNQGQGVDAAVPSHQSGRQQISTTSKPPSSAARVAPKPTEKLNRRLVEEESAQAYVSPSRRRKPQPRSSPPLDDSKPIVAPEPTAELDIFSSNQQIPTQSRPAENQTLALSSTTKQAAPLPKRPDAPTRSIPQVSASSLSQSTKHRMAGTAAFKRGDYASAHASYTSAIAPLPQNHPILAILHSNRALTSLKIGDPKAAMSDANITLDLIGPSHGEGETVHLGEGEQDKPMKEFYGKALMRKAEALEHMEKWSDAAKIWREAVEAGVGGPISLQARNRCEKAAGLAPSSASTSGRPSPASATSKPASKPPQSVKPKPRSAAADLASSKESEAVTRLRAANAAATAASDEAFALSDSVEAKLNAWKDGKEGNLRGLLASLDSVLWEGAGWAKVGMGDLVMPNRCKVVYMKAIAKCHPDKIPPDASIEQRMISASVFATLNEAWDRFKTDNGL